MVLDLEVDVVPLDGILIGPKGGEGGMERVGKVGRVRGRH